MALEILNIHTTNPHENLQFRRVAKYLKKMFSDRDLNGLLIGNPSSSLDEYSRFRADAILYCSIGFWVIDFKDYRKGELLLPVENEFSRVPWFMNLENELEPKKVEGGSFVNPYEQLRRYRGLMKKIIKANPILSREIDANYIKAFNVFSGPIILTGEIPGSINRYYSIYDEKNLGNGIVDYQEKTVFSKESVEVLKRIFPAPEWEEDIEVSWEEGTKRIFEIEKDLESEIDVFLDQEESGILILESMDSDKRDEWVDFIISKAGEKSFPQKDIWSHSARIRRRIKNRSGLDSDSLFSTIYGGNRQTEDIENDTEEGTVDTSKEIVPIKSNDFIDEKGLVILHEAHLITRSLNQSDLLRFGSGRLLEDLIQFLDLQNTSRKLVCIGDPYSLSYGKESESAINVENLKNLFEGEIRHYRKPPVKDASSFHLMRSEIGESIDINMYNRLSYPFVERSFIKEDKTGVLSLLKHWFGTPIEAEPGKAMLVYSNKHAHQINTWIKKNVLNNGTLISEGDLLMVNNNVSVPDETGLGVPRTLSNGMYVTVKKVVGNTSESFLVKNVPVQLEYTKIKVNCVSLEGNPEAEVWLLNNYIYGEEKLAKEEEIALKMLLSRKVKEQIAKTPFETSDEYKDWLRNPLYKEFNLEVVDLEAQLTKGEKVKTKLQEAEVKRNKLERKYKRTFLQRMVFKVSKEDPILNALQSKYGWCITVHKAVGSQFSEICINASQGKENGYSNESYFRWLYSGLTTAMTKVHIINEVELNPLKDCIFHDIEELSEIKLKPAKSKTLILESFEGPVWIPELIPTGIDENIRRGISHFSMKMYEKGISLEKVTEGGNYLTKAYFSLPEIDAKDLCMLFNNNGKFEVTSIRPEGNAEGYEETIEEGLEYLKEKSLGKTTISSVEIPADFRQFYYKNWIEKSDTSGGSLQLVSTHTYDDVFLFSQGEAKVKFKVTFGDSGFFSTFRALKKTDPEISQKAYNLFFND